MLRDRILRIRTMITEINKKQDKIFGKTLDYNKLLRNLQERKDSLIKEKQRLMYQYSK